MGGAKRPLEKIDTQTLRIAADAPEEWAPALSEAQRVLRSGLPVALPTETVYGLAARLFDPEAILGVYRAKERPFFDPLIVHVPSLDHLRSYGLVDWSAMSPDARDAVENLARRFWPGPLTLILPKTSRVPDLATSGLNSVAIRCPKHPFFLALLQQLNEPLVAPSANRFGRISPTCGDDVASELTGRIPLIIDAGRCEVGLESTVIRIESPGKDMPFNWSLMRPGQIGREEIAQTLARADTPFSKTTPGALASPGLTESHYAPSKPLELLQVPIADMDGDTLKARLSTLENPGFLLFDPRSARIIERMPRVKNTPGPPTFVLAPDGRMETAARRLFEGLRWLDGTTATLLIAEPPPRRSLPENSIAVAILDRLKRAAGRGLSALLLILVAATAAADTRRAEPPLHGGTIDLHAHLFMKQGMPLVFRGDFEEPLHATDWEAKFSSNANADTLNASGNRIVVLALYAHPLFTRSLKDSVRKQMDRAEDWVRRNPNWVIARSPDEARIALQNGKRALIYALEGASGILDSESDLAEFVDRRGIRIVTLLHLTDDHFGGVAFLKGSRILASPVAWLKSLFWPAERDGVRVNAAGLTRRGLEMARSLVQRGVWIDLAHASDASQGELIPLLRQAGQPLLYTHTVLRDFFPAERALHAEQLRWIAESGGILGLMPSDRMLEGTPRSDRFPECDEGVPALARHFNQAAAIVGNESVVLGSDFNGGLEHLSPRCKTGTELDSRGLWNLGQEPELWKALRKAGARLPERADATLERFLDAWKRATLARL